MKEGKVLDTRKPPHRQSQGGRFGTSEGTKQRKFSREITAKQHFSAEKQLTRLYLQQRVGAGCQGTGSGIRSQEEDQGWLP